MSSEIEAVVWLRAQIEARKAQAVAAASVAGPDWHCDRFWPEDGSTATTMILSAAGSPLADTLRRDDEEMAPHIAANDPQDTIARCDAELAILETHYILHREDRSEAYEEFSVIPHPGAGGCDFGCVTCHYRGMGGVWGKGYCLTVRLLAGGYRYWPGYREEDWKQS